MLSVKLYVCQSGQICSLLGMSKLESCVSQRDDQMWGEGEARSQCSMRKQYHLGGSESLAFLSHTLVGGHVEERELEFHAQLCSQLIVLLAAPFCQKCQVPPPHLFPHTPFAPQATYVWSMTASFQLQFWKTPRN